MTAALPWVMLLFVSQAEPAAAKLPQMIAVDLFQAHPLSDRLRIDGPAEVVSPLRRSLPAGSYEICSRCGSLSLRFLPGNLRSGGGAGAGKATVLVAPSFCLRGSGEHGLLIHYCSSVSRHYRGVLKFKCDRLGKLQVTNNVPVHDYVVSVVGSETLPSFGKEVLKAQAVLTQSRLAHYRPGDELGDTTEREAYLGSDYERPGLREAVACVDKKILTYNGLAITPFYHAACAGGTSAGAVFFGGKSGTLPYLVSRQCRLCQGSPFWRQTVSIIPKQVFEKSFGPGYPKIVQSDAQMRPLKVVLGNGKTLGGFEFWLRLGQSLGWDKVPGTRYSLSATPQGSLKIASTGAGHGVGMCQWGAAELARQGKTYRQILEYYLPGAVLEDQK